MKAFWNIENIEDVIICVVFLFIVMRASQSFYVLCDNHLSKIHNSAFRASYFLYFRSRLFANINWHTMMSGR
jgi:hypothetical protein